jgi:hypothetical protein
MQHAMKTYGEWRFSSTFLDLGTKMDVIDQLHASAALHPEEEPPYPLYRRLGGLQSQFGHCGGDNVLLLPGIERRPSSP